VEKAVKQILIKKVIDGEGFDRKDSIAMEEPLEIRLEFGADGDRRVQNISVTMRTPGSDAALATGFLFTEGIAIACIENKENVIQVCPLTNINTL
jgi:FdhD protein